MFSRANRCGLRKTDMNGKSLGFRHTLRTPMNKVTSKSTLRITSWYLVNGARGSGGSQFKQRAGLDQKNAQLKIICIKY